jgi:hypothetical protein
MSERPPRPPLFDLRDGHVYGGLLVATIGGFAVSWSWTLVALGSILSALGLFHNVHTRPVAILDVARYSQDDTGYGARHRRWGRMGV